MMECLENELGITTAIDYNGIAVNMKILNVLENLTIGKTLDFY